MLRALGAGERLNLGGGGVKLDGEHYIGVRTVLGTRATWRRISTVKIHHATRTLVSNS